MLNQMLNKPRYLLAVVATLLVTACDTDSGKEEVALAAPAPVSDQSQQRPAGAPPEPGAMGGPGAPLGNRAPPPQEPESDSVPDLITTYKRVGETELSAHIFYPEGHSLDDETPVLLFMHGGGLRRGSPSQGYAFADRFTPEGVAVVSVQYRLLDDTGTKLNHIIADAKSAVRWLREHANELGMDPQRIAMFGHSAGAFLVLSTGVLPILDEASENSDVSSVPNALIPWSSVTTRRDDPENSMVPAGMTMQDMSPATYVRGGLPAALFIHGSEDPIASPEAAVAFEQAYRAAGNQSSFEMIEGADHFFATPDHKAQVMDLVSDYLTSLGYSSM